MGWVKNMSEEMNNGQGEGGFKEMMGLERR
jgi:hypothetical protein